MNNWWQDPYQARGAVYVAALLVLALLAARLYGCVSN
jgi:hypothetical protein